MKLIDGQFYNVAKQRYTGITAKKKRVAGGNIVTQNLVSSTQAE